MPPKALVGAAIGTAIMFLFGVLWLFVGFSGGRFFPASLRVVLSLAGVGLALWIVLFSVHAARASRSALPPTPEEGEFGRKISRRFGLINGIQGAAIAAAVFGCAALHRPDLIAPVVAVIVGLHFLPLAGIFQLPVYYATGVLGCVIGCASLLIPGSAARLSAIGLSFGLLLWLTVGAVLITVSRFKAAVL